MIKFSCPACSKSLRTAKEHAGKPCKCTRCGTGVRVPSVNRVELQFEVAKRMPTQDQAWNFGTIFAITSLSILLGCFSGFLIGCIYKSLSVSKLQSKIAALDEAKKENQFQLKELEQDRRSLLRQVVELKVENSRVSSSLAAELADNKKNATKKVRNKTGFKQPSDSASLIDDSVKREFAKTREIEQADEALQKWLKDNYVKKYVSKTYGRTQIILAFEHKRVFVPKNIGEKSRYPTEYSNPIRFVIGYRNGNSGELRIPSGGFIKLNGKTVEMEYFSSNHNVIELSGSDATYASLKGKGKAACGVRLPKNEELCIEVEAVGLPINCGFDSGSSKKELVEALGIPDTQKEISVTWPETKSVDGISYGAQVGRTLWREHWIYEKYPGCVVVISGNKVSKLVTTK